MKDIKEVHPLMEYVLHKGGCFLEEEVPLPKNAKNIQNEWRNLCVCFNVFHWLFLRIMKSMVSVGLERGGTRDSWHGDVRRART